MFYYNNQILVESNWKALQNVWRIPSAHVCRLESLMSNFILCIIRLLSATDYVIMSACVEKVGIFCPNLTIGWPSSGAKLHWKWRYSHCWGWWFHNNFLQRKLFVIFPFIRLLRPCWTVSVRFSYTFKDIFWRKFTCQYIKYKVLMPNI